MLKTKVKAGSITNLTDARYFAAWEAEWLGFNFDEGAEDNISPTNMIAIKEWVDGVKIVGEFGAVHSAEDIAAIVKLVELDAVQLGMLVDIETAMQLSNTPIIKEFVVQNETTESDITEHLSDFSAYTDTFLINFTKSGFTWEELKTSKRISLNYIKELCQQYQVIIALDFAGDMIDAFLEEVSPYGISLKGGEEEKVGFKSFDEIDEVFEAMEVFE